MKHKVLACLSIITAMQAARACSCTEIYDKEFMDTFEHVVVATVISKITVYANRRVYKLAIQEIIKGDGKATVLYSDTRSNCAANFRQGESYIIFTNSAPKNQISICASRRINRAASEDEIYQKIYNIGTSGHRTSISP